MRSVQRKIRGAFFFTSHGAAIVQARNNQGEKRLLQKFVDVFLEIPTIVHGRTEQSLGTDNVEQQRDDFLVRRIRQHRSCPRLVFEMLDDHGAVLDTLTVG
ncbi:MAG: hypothetical protein GY866_30750 [Proteobacteria bacterium]|nr:hypothetical protein [Pseudomonadota bacterium]